MPELVYAHRSGKATAYRYNSSPVPRSRMYWIRKGEEGIGDTKLDRLWADRRGHCQAADAGTRSWRVHRHDPPGCRRRLRWGVIYRLATGTKVLYFGFDLGSFAIAVLGAVVILALYRLIART